MLVRGIAERSSRTDDRIAILPAGARPARDIYFTVMTNSGVGRVTIDPTGHIDSGNIVE